MRLSTGFSTGQVVVLLLIGTTNFVRIFQAVLCEPGGGGIETSHRFPIIFLTFIVNP